MRLLPSSQFVDRWLWLCPVISILLAALVLYLFGFTWWSAILVAVLLVCPATVIWGGVLMARDAWNTRRRAKKSD